MSDRQFWRLLREADKRATRAKQTRIFYTVAEVAGMLGIKPATVRRYYIRPGRLKATMRYRGGNHEDPRSWCYRITWPDLQAFLETDLFPGRPRPTLKVPAPDRGAKGQFLPANGRLRR